MTDNGNPTRIEVIDGQPRLVPGDDDLGSRILAMSEEELARTLSEMLVALRRGQFRLIKGGAQ
jgi:hypothetical protein